MSTLHVGSAYPTAKGQACILMGFGKNSETMAHEAIYRSGGYLVLCGEGLYWVLPAEDFEAKVFVPEAAPEPVFAEPMGLYRHSKGTLYHVLTRARCPITLENRLVYRDNEGHTWVRPETMFAEEVTWPDGTRGRRFKKLDAEG